MRIYGEEEFWPGPLWTAMIFDGLFPHAGSPGDLYINRHKNPPLIYFFTTERNTKLVSKEEVEDWIHNGWMSAPTLDPVNPPPYKTLKTTLSTSLPHLE